MLKLKILCIVFSFSFQALPSFSATEFEGFIPLEVAEVLFDLANNGQFAVYSDIMDDFPPFQVPDGFSIVGSVYHSGRLRVGLETQASADDAIEAISSAFTSAGWQSMPSPLLLTPQTGFISSTVLVSRTIQICHDELGHVSIRFSERDSGNFVVLDEYSGLSRNQGTCAYQLARQTRMSTIMSTGVGIRQYMPRMEVPVAPGRRPALGWVGGGSSTSDTQAETETNLEIDWSLAEVYKHFADQIIGQEWELDTETIGNVSANGNWTRSPTQGMNLIGTLTVLEFSDSNFQLKFRIVSSGRSGGNVPRIYRVPQ